MNKLCNSYYNSVKIGIGNFKNKLTSEHNLTAEKITMIEKWHRRSDTKKSFVDGLEFFTNIELSYEILNMFDWYMMMLVVEEEIREGQEYSICDMYKLETNRTSEDEGFVLILVIGENDSYEVFEIDEDNNTFSVVEDSYILEKVANKYK